MKYIDNDVSMDNVCNIFNCKRKESDTLVHVYIIIVMYVIQTSIILQKMLKI